MSGPTIAVVGAGIVGCLTAREIVSRWPDASVVVLDRDAVGDGASRRSAGLHFPRGGTERVRRMAAHSQAYYQRLKEACPSLPIHPIGMCVVAPEASTRRLQEIYLDRAALTRVDPPDGLIDHVAGQPVRLPDGFGAWQVGGGQYADVHALTQALAWELRPRVSIREGIRVAAVEPTGAGVAVRLATGEALTVDHAVLTPGPWLADPAWAALVAPLGARVKKIVALHIEQSPLQHDRSIVFHDEDAFLLPIAHRRHWLFSYTCQEWDVDPDTVAKGLSRRNLDEARECLRRYSPTLPDRCTAGRVFCDAYSADGEPQVRPLDSDGRVIFAGAANGSGYRLAPAIAAEAADLLTVASGHMRSHI